MVVPANLTHSHRLVRLSPHNIRASALVAVLGAVLFRCYMMHQIHELEPVDNTYLIVGARFFSYLCSLLEWLKPRFVLPKCFI
jgi:hypothetical protein